MSDFEKKILDYKNKLKNTKDLEEVESIRTEIFGKSGFINLEFKKIGSLSIDEKKNIASNIYDEHGNSLENKKDNPIFKERAENLIFKDIEKTLLKIGMEFDAFFNENTLYDNGDIDKVIELLDEKGLIYKKDGATWFKGTDLGREVDRVMIKSTGEPTYRLPDIAYHRNKFDRKYDLMIDVFGADHMDAYPDVIAATSALGYEENKIKVLIHQFVTIIKDSAPIKMSTRKANFIGLDELIDCLLYTSPSPRDS